MSPREALIGAPVWIGYIYAVGAPQFSSPLQRRLLARGTRRERDRERDRGRGGGGRWQGLADEAVDGAAKRVGRCQCGAASTAWVTQPWASRIRRTARRPLRVGRMCRALLVAAEGLADGGFEGGADRGLVHAGPDAHLARSKRGQPGRAAAGGRGACRRPRRRPRRQAGAQPGSAIRRGRLGGEFGRGGRVDRGQAQSGARAMRPRRAEQWAGQRPRARAASSWRGGRRRRPGGRRGQQGGTRAARVEVITATGVQGPHGLQGGSPIALPEMSRSHTSCH